MYDSSFELEKQTELMQNHSHRNLICRMSKVILYSFMIWCAIKLDALNPYDSLRFFKDFFMYSHTPSWLYVSQFMGYVFRFHQISQI